MILISSVNFSKEEERVEIRKRKTLNIILALLISFVAWIYVVYNFDPTCEIKYKDVPIKFVGEDILADKGLAVSKSNYDAIDVSLEQQRVDTKNISADNISVIADVSAAVEGENGISLEIEGPAGTEVTETEADSISLAIEYSYGDDFDISVQYKEKVDTQFEPYASNMTYDRVSAVGSKSNIQKIDRVVAYLNATEVSNEKKRFTVEPIAIDKNGEKINHIVILPSEIRFTAVVGTTKEVKLVTNVINSQDNGYNRIYETEDKVMIKGPAQKIKKIDTITTKKIDISNIYEDKSIDIEYNLPNGIKIAESSLGQKIKVKVSKR